MKLIDLLRDNSIDVSFPCNGNGTCGKCKVICNELPVTDLDRCFLSVDEIEEGIRLACAAEVDENFDLRMLKTGIYEYDETKLDNNKIEKNIIPVYEKRFSFAIDIGTTTIVIAVVDIGSGDIIDNITVINPQRTFGADVISRIKASNEGNCIKLQELIINCINSYINKLIKRNKIDSHNINKIVISANTTMVHLLMGYSCLKMGVYPFVPFSVEGCIQEANLLLKRDDLSNASLYIIPMISAFVGGDIVSGIYTSRMHEKEDISLLIDLGTNGEMVLGNKYKLIATSTAAGPAFEGCNISIGVPSVEGAIYDTYIVGRKRIQYKTIGGKTPVGLCGSGLISLVSDMLDCRYIDESGLLENAFFDDGYAVLPNLRIKQRDIRELQLAKSAIRSGIEILCDNYGISHKDISNIYIAGSFGKGLDIRKAKNIGLLPNDILNICSIGNSTLSGAIQCCLNDSTYNYMKNISKKCETFLISENDDFDDRYLRFLSFSTEK